MLLPRSTRRACGVALSVALAAAAVAACREPTEIMVEISTDIPCDQIDRTSIYVGSPTAVGQPLGKLTVSAETSACNAATKRIGSIVVLPSGETTDTVAIRLVARLKGSDCDNNLTTGCVDARRSLGFLAHTSLRLPIALNADCKNVVCGSTDTCSGGKCTPALVDPNTCVTSGCPDPVVDAGVVDAPSTCAPLLSATTYVWHFDDPTDATTQEANLQFPPTILNPGSSIGPGAPGCGRALVRTPGAPTQQLASAKLLTASAFQVAIRFRTTQPALAVSNFGTLGWSIGLAQGHPFAKLCTPSCSVSSDLGKTLNDDAWHTLTFDTANGNRALVDGVLDTGINLVSPTAAPDGFLSVDGAGSLDELEFHAN